MNELVERVGRTLEQRRLFKRGEGIVVAVSGGLDSMVLLDVVQRLAARARWRLVVAHFNHQLRGAESAGDERFVRRTAKRLGLPFVGERWPVAGHGRAKELGMEMAARLARHEFLGRVATKRKIRAVALAHHADDQAELFFLRLFRGAGGEGLSGMKWTGAGIRAGSRRRPVVLVRPFLDSFKKDLLTHATANGVKFREDSSNASPRHARNRIRHELLPLLARHYEPAIVRTVVRAMDLVGMDADFVREEAERWLSASGRIPFERLHPAVQRQGLRLQLNRMCVTPNYELVEQLRLRPNTTVTADDGCAVSRDDAGRIVRSDHRPAEFDPTEVSIDLRGRPGARRFDGVQVGWKVAETGRGFRRPAPRAGHECFDAAKVGPAATLRHWREGDRFQPIGMAQAVKLQDLFTNLKIPRTRRRELLVATVGGGEIWWVEGLRIGERFKLEETTTRVLNWRWSRMARAERGDAPGPPGRSGVAGRRFGR